MITINLDKIKVKTAKNQSGVLIGNNNAQNWTYFSKGNTNVSGNHVSDNVNIILDNDEGDFVVHDSDDVKQVNNDGGEEILINKKKTMTKKKQPPKPMKKKKMKKVESPKPTKKKQQQPPKPMKHTKKMEKKSSFYHKSKKTG